MHMEESNRERKTTDNLSLEQINLTEGEDYKLKEGKVGFCFVFGFQQFLSIPEVRKLNEALLEVRRDIDTINKRNVYYKFGTSSKDKLEEIDDSLIYLQDIKDSLPNKEALGPDSQEGYSAEIKTFIETVDYLKRDLSQTHLTSRLMSVKDKLKTSDPAGVEFTDKEVMFSLQNLLDILKKVKQIRIKSSYRWAADRDTEKIKNTFNQLSFDTRVYSEKNIKTKEDIKRILGLYLERQDVSDAEKSRHEYVVLVISSHGDWVEEEKQSVICLPDGQYFTVEDCTQVMENSSFLTGRPKILFVNACRGQKINMGNIVSDASQADEAEDCFDVETPREKYMGMRIPCHSFFVIHYSTLPLYVSYRHESEGSFFIKTLCEHLSDPDKVRGTPLHRILLEVNDKINTDEMRDGKTLRDNKKLQMPVLISTSLGDFRIVKEEVVKVNQSMANQSYNDFMRRIFLLVAAALLQNYRI